jgi:hypothetical protein
MEKKAQSTKTSGSESGFLDLFRESISRSPVEKRRTIFETRLLEASLYACECKSLFAVSALSNNSPPNREWRVFANTIMALDKDSLPIIIAKGTPEVFSLRSDELESVLFDKESRREEILFGTSCWLYWNDDGWKIGTKRQADATGISLRSKSPVMWKSLMLAILGPSADQEKAFVDKLDKKLCYGFVLYDRAQHIFSYGNAERKLWHISTYEGLERRDNTLGLPSPTIPSSSLSSELESLGFIIRRRDENYIVKTPLYVFIEREIGKATPLREVVAKLVYLSPSEEKLFNKTFPYLVPYRAEAGKCLEKLTSYVEGYYDMLHGNSKLCDTPEIANLYLSIVSKIEKRDDIGAILSSPMCPAKRLVKRMLLSLLPTEIDEISRSFTIH